MPNSMTSWRSTYPVMQSSLFQKVTCESYCAEYKHSILITATFICCQYSFLIHFVFVHSRTARKEYIVAKYAERRYVLPKEHSEAYRVFDTVRSKDLMSLLQLYAEGEDLSKPVSIPDGQVRPLSPTTLIT